MARAARRVPPRSAPPAASADASLAPIAQPPHVALPVDTLQAVTNLLQRIVLDGNEAQALLNRIAQQVVPATPTEG